MRTIFCNDTSERALVNEVRLLCMKVRVIDVTIIYVVSFKKIVPIQQSITNIDLLITFYW